MNKSIQKCFVANEHIWNGNSLFSRVHSINTCSISTFIIPNRFWDPDFRFCISFGILVLLGLKNHFYTTVFRQRDNKVWNYKLFPILRYFHGIPLSRSSKEVEVERPKFNPYRTFSPPSNRVKIVIRENRSNFYSWVRKGWTSSFMLPKAPMQCIQCPNM